MDRTSTNTVNRELGIIDFDKMKELLGEAPEIFAMDFPKIFPFRTSEFLPPNTIIISKDLAIKLGIWRDDELKPKPRSKQAER